LPGWSGAETAQRIRHDLGVESPPLVGHTASLITLHIEEARAAGCADFISKPFEEDQIFQCLERLLGVRFERAEADLEPARLDPPLTWVSVPEDLCARLMVAAELHSTTALKGCLQELRQLGPEPERLAGQIRELMRSYDMDGIQRLLTSVTSAPTTETGRLPANSA